MKKSALALCVATMFAGVSHAKPVHYPVADFSDDYQAMIEADGDTHKIHVYQTGQNQPVISQDSELSDYDLTLNDEHKITVNVSQIPYGEQSVLIFDDFNFDGNKDLALKTGNYSCYGGPSYNIYLATGNGFALSDAFSELAHNHCGMFDVETDKKLIHTMSKSGCCYHEYSHYRVVDGVPILAYTLIDQVYLTDFNDFYYLNETFFDKANQERDTYLLTNQTPLFAFNLAESGKLVVIYQSQYGIDYVLLDSNQLTASHPNDLFEGGYEYPRVEFSYQLAQAGILPANATRQKHWHNSSDNSIQPPTMPNADTLIFKNGDTTYTIKEKNLGITVTQGNKRTFLAGVKSSQIGSLKAVFDALNTVK
ncbi:MAG: hypothetical protein Q4A69_05010 [Moraxella sp.]|nr:hypothetical protein [Moraxella sp.]